jgi:hypothetical protein
LTQEQKRALADLPPEYRHAFVESGKAGREELATQAVQLSRLNQRKWADFGKEAKGPAQQGGKELGAALMQGGVLGVSDHSPALAAAVRTAVHNAIEAGKAEAGAHSPSQVMRRLGVDMMVGLADGINDAEQKAIDAAARAIEKSIDQVTSALDKIKSKASSFRDAIRSGFGDFMDLSAAFGLGTEEGGLGPTTEAISAFLGQQVASAQQLADVLRALKAQGAGQGLLTQVAAGGAEAIPFAQALLQGGPGAVNEVNTALQEIAALAGETGRQLSESFFGKGIERLEKKLDRLHDDLHTLADLERQGHGHDINMDSQKVAEAVRRELIKTGKQNGDIFG